MIDRELVTRKLVLIAKDLEALRSLAAKPLEAYLESDIDEPLAERYLERVIGRMIDVNFHVVTEAGLPPPKDYYQSFLDLARVGVLDHELAARLAPCTGLRNRIAHEYDDVDPTRVHEALGTAVGDVPAYMTAVRDHLDRNAG